MEEGLALMGNMRWHRLSSELYRLQGELLFAAADSKRGWESAEMCLRRALTTAQSQHTKPLELRAATSLCRLWQHQGRRADAHHLLTGVYRWFTEGFDTADLRAAKALLHDLE